MAGQSIKILGRILRKSPQNLSLAVERSAYNSYYPDSTTASQAADQGFVDQFGG